MKNKKGNKNQQYIAQVEKQVKSGGDPRARKVEEERAAEKKRKEDAKRLEEEKKALFKPVMTQKVENGMLSALKTLVNIVNSYMITYILIEVFLTMFSWAFVM